MKRAVGNGIRVVLAALAAALAVGGGEAPAAAPGSHPYAAFDRAARCRGCHPRIFEEWEQSLMAQSFTHPWDQAEYFRLALPHSGTEPKVAGVRSGCIACHAPLAFLAGDIPPKPAGEGTRANEGVTCDVCHTVTGSSAAEPFNFSYELAPGKVKRGGRGDGRSPYHRVQRSDFVRSPELCATCHDEQSPYGAWVKSTYREWKAGPYAREGTRCQDCHMYRAPGKAARGGRERADVAHHNFHGSHVPSKLAGAVDVALYAERPKVRPGGTAVIRVALFNGKAGHFIPTGSTEERMLWLEVTAVDAAGRTYRLPVDRKGFAGEAYTVADPAARAYVAMGEILGIRGFDGVERDAPAPAGSRIFRRPFFDPKGRMTICQWYTADNTRVDYRIGPRETKIETYTWRVPETAAPGELRVRAELKYAQVPAAVARLLELPADEAAPIRVNTAELRLTVEGPGR
ncbi:hypothetical protein G3N55_03665 [Dissulfurirhabdus thermomarina]|uniref:Cytochrome c-552/4 domain-containing protein n=1 Tax=Dissulfurirhabdus thermomarina TaxID=1765737 RepID=A0A6N9TTX3_DISTH|nr:multiheme c-type cytochrome [Dissulfurirhabdus thermomarina]NDY41946.1 hypothetical protein [Dissulfurirhabdus thermomarina]NMX22930.1 hypothetical protein [Dissulfurirhabdus thermomarina]